jgi:hypothetical protein
MNPQTFKKALHILLPVLLLAVASLACSVGATPTPTPVPPTAIPTATPTPEPETETYTNEASGLSLEYPADWLVQEGDNTIYVSNIADPAHLSSQDEGADMAVMLTPQEAATRAYDAEEWLNMLTMEARIGSATLGEPESVTIGGVEGLRCDITNTEDNTRGWLAVIVTDDYVYIFAAAVKPVGDWNNYQDTFNAIVDSIEFPASSSK